MVHYTGSVIAVPLANRQKYIEHARSAWPLFHKYGALRMVDCWGVDVPKGKVTDFYGAVAATEDEAIVFSWIEWPDSAVADAAWQSISDDPEIQNMAPMPFDGTRMIFGGFDPILHEGNDHGAAYIQGFLLAVPQANKDAYHKMAQTAWGEAFKPYGCLCLVEAWGRDVPRGKHTDFYRAAKAEDGEVPVFSWAAWPDKATCDAANKSMEADMQGKDFPAMPFDGMRMMWGGFEVISDLGT
ncbi:DUF1428 domain-containing protein [Paracoccus sp. (in: a-proteobacteria)]|uniref:DUF1428 domain-containing protein n=1 Tax=Paracoccus sp. TaxID=267 RepID=UPI0028A0FD25|nr:DUF1428 domain-containing protein [Paracoccus sp. (in: a-proteobacteria)]